MFNGCTKENLIGPLKNSTGKIITNDLMKSNLMNNFFANVGQDLANEIPEEDLNSHVYRVTPTLDKTEYSIDLLKKSFKSAVKIGKACGTDGITATDLKINEEVSINSLHKVVKKSIDSGIFPFDRKKKQKLLPFIRKDLP